MNSYQFEPIGYIETCFKERFGTPRQPTLAPSSWGRLKLRADLNLDSALEGLEGFSHLWLVFVFHQNENVGVKTKVHPPRMAGEKAGLFATRTPHRPNPIGLSAVKLDRVEAGVMYFSGVDLLDGTPILDIKPYIAATDGLSETRAGWTCGLPERTLQVEFSLSALEQIADFFGERTERAEAAIREVLQLDPRPVFYRGSTERPNPYTDVYGFRFDDFNVVYRMAGTLATVLSLQQWSEYLRVKSATP